MMYACDNMYMEGELKSYLLWFQNNLTLSTAPYGLLVHSWKIRILSDLARSSANRAVRPNLYKQKRRIDVKRKRNHNRKGKNSAIVYSNKVFMVPPFLQYCFDFFLATLINLFIFHLRIFMPDSLFSSQGELLSMRVLRRRS